jgi:anti-sigma B factor antagonist
MQPGELAISDEVDASRARLRLRGELDLLTAPQLEAAVERLSGNGVREVLLDLSELAFLDSSGFRAILTCKTMCERRGCTFLMTRGPERVQKVFDISGVLKKLPFV